MGHIVGERGSTLRTGTPDREIMLQDVLNLSDEDRTRIGQAIAQHGDGEHPVADLNTVGFFRVAYACECLVRAREAGAGYPETLKTLGDRLLRAIPLIRR